MTTLVQHLASKFWLQMLAQIGEIDTVGNNCIHHWRTLSSDLIQGSEPVWVISMTEMDIVYYSLYVCLRIFINITAYRIIKRLRQHTR